MKRRDFLAATTAAALMALAPSLRAGAPLLFHDHGHGLSFSTDGKTLFAPSHHGLAAYEDGQWWEAPGPAQGFSGFSVADGAIYSSGHAGAGASSPGRPAGLLRSLDGGRTWQAVALAGEADFKLIAAGFRSGAIYVLNTMPNAALHAAGLFVTRDAGRTWQASAARGLEGEIHGLAAHPVNADIVAVASSNGLYLSRDSAQSFRLMDGSEPVTAVSFDHKGHRLLYARALSGDLVEQAIIGSGRRAARLPRMGGDYVTCLAHSPVDDEVIAIATRRLHVFITRDGGRTWRQLASNGAARGSGPLHGDEE